MQLQAEQLAQHAEMLVPRLLFFGPRDRIKEPDLIAPT